MRTRMLTMGIAALMIASTAPAVAQPPPDTGRIVGTLTKNDGTPVGNASVSLIDIRGHGTGYTTTNADGTFVIPNVVARQGNDQYKIQFQPWGAGDIQYAFRKKTREEADFIQVIPGQDTVVNDTLFPTGSVKFTASDAVTGAPITNFCGEVIGRNGRNGCTENGVITLSDVPPGDYDATANGYPDYFEHRSKVSVTAEQVTEIHAKLAPTAKISTTVLDAVTKAPVPDVCVYAKSRAVPDGDFPYECSGPDGRVTVTRLTTGAYELWTEPRDGVHGAQWVGPNGGTGSHLLAKTIKATAGQTTTTSPILLDGAGSISGSVVDSRTGAPVASVCAFPRAGYADWPVDRPACTKQDGKYTLSGLGPYHWPVHFVDNIGPYAWQWSGDQPSQLTARQIKVRVGQSVTENAHLAQGNTISGKVTGSGDLTVYHAITGDRVASYTFPDANGNYTLTNIAGNQPVKVKYREYRNPSYFSQWYKDAKDFASARPILVRPGTPVTGIDFTVTPH